MIKSTLCAILCTSMLTTGCVTRPPKPLPDLEYREIPEAYLQECVLPAVPLSNGEMSDAFAQAYQCAEQGNKDKQRIRELN